MRRSAAPALLGLIPSASGVARSVLAVSVAALMVAALVTTAVITTAVVPTAARGDDSASTPPSSSGEKTLESSAPDFTAKGVDGKSYQLQDFLKKGPVLLDFWTTWCKPCMQELPQLQKIWESQREKGFTLLTIASDDQKSSVKIKPTILSKGFKFPVLVDPDRKVGNLYNVRNYPTTVLIAPDGHIALVAQGYQPGSEKDLEKRIVALLPGAGGGH